ncbi:TIR-like protein FxsC [Streptomyces sp. Marseille-Q5077]|uniref:TIR-like protein FxsC n=1 Tax=Streptomyces sp. Marseille-Q5077 TaxID=3418995 RepID=UPI003CFFA8E1
MTADSATGAGGSGPHNDVLREELVRLLGAGGGPDAGDALDVLWIARLGGLDPLDWSLLGDGTDPTAGPPPETHLPPPGPDDQPAQPDGPAAPSAELHLPGGDGGSAPVRPGAAHAIRVSQPQALPDALVLTRALRPMRQVVPSAVARVLDVEATAAASGDTGLLLPITRPSLERRFSVDLLIDTGTTMTVWHRLADELRTLLARHGAFAGVRAWALQTDTAEPTLAPFRRGAQAVSPTRRWRQALADPAGRRVVLVLTDGVGPAWYGSELPGTLADWSARRPVAALQVLPSRLWHRTALRTAPVRALGTEADRATIEVRSAGPLPGIARGSAGAEERARIRWLPVLELSGDWLDPWSRLVSGRTTDWVPLQAAPLTVAERPGRSDPADEPGSPAGWVESFEEGYSPQAFQLLRLLAAAPLSLPVMRLVQRAMLPTSTAMNLAEIFLSGILVRRTPDGPGEDPDSVVYDFRPGVRDLLLDRLTRTESLRVLERVISGVSERVAATFGGVTDFGALVAAAEENGGLDGLELPEGSRAFAEVALAVIGGVGGDYAQVAAKLTRARAQAAPRVAPEADPAPREPEKEEGRGRQRRPWLLPWRRRGRDDALDEAAETEAEATTVAAGGDVTRAVDGARVPSRVPSIPRSYVRRDEAADVRHALLADLPSADVGYPIPHTATCVIEGPPGAGKTALAIDVAHTVGGGFAMVRWIRAHDRDRLVEELLAFADDLGIPGSGVVLDVYGRLAELRSYLMGHPGWLLIYDGVTSGTFRLLLADWPTERLLLPPDGYGAWLVTASAEVSLPELPHTTVTLGDMDRDTAVRYLVTALDPHRGKLWRRAQELADLVDVLGTNPSVLAGCVSEIDKESQPISSVVTRLFARGQAGEGAVRSLVWITQDGSFVGTGIALLPDVVLTTRPHPPSAVRVCSHGDIDVGVVGSAGHSDLPGLEVLKLERAALPAVQPSSGDGRPLVALSYRSDGVLELRSATPKEYPLPEGAALFDVGGRLCSVVTTSGKRRTTRVRITTDDVDRLVSLFGPSTLHVRDREPEPSTSEPRRRAPLFFLSYAHSDARADVQLRFFSDVSRHVLQLTTLEVTDPGFMDERLPLGENWRGQIYGALAEAQVFVPLFSPKYFESAWCQRELNIFQWRQELTRGTESGGGPEIVPVHWAPFAPAQMPPSLASVQYKMPEFGSVYATQGLLGLWESGQHLEYRRAVWLIAQRIAEVAETSPLPPVDPRLFDNEDGER